MVKNIPSEQITHGFPIVLPKNSPDLLWLNPREVLIGKATDIENYLTLPFRSTENLEGDGDGDGGSGDESVDKVDLTDIESITYTKYYDSVTKATKYKAVIKIRNSSSDKSNVQGVDARIYNPSGE
jgi:hypothetical protein